MHVVPPGYRDRSVGRGGLEPPRVSPLDPKSSAYANSAIYPIIPGHILHPLLIGLFREAPLIYSFFEGISRRVGGGRRGRALSRTHDHGSADLRSRARRRLRGRSAVLPRVSG